MKSFLAKFAGLITGVLSGFDRVLLSGSLMALCYSEGFQRFLNVIGVLRANFGKFAKEQSDLVCEESLKLAKRLGRPSEYLTSSGIRKNERAREIAERDRIREGLICTLSCVEPCRTFRVKLDPKTKRFGMVLERRKCLFLYNYWIDPVFGFMHTRLQTWFPFGIQVCINGREMLARQMDRAGVGYKRRENCFVRIDDVPRAQALANEQLRIPWAENLDRLAELANPALSQVLGKFRQTYYWSAMQSEWATDFMFKDAGTLSSIYRPIVMHAVADFSSPQVLRFLGSRLTPNLKKEVTTRWKVRPEGICLKHAVGFNSVKIYNKQESVLRVETTINDASAFTVMRPKKGGPKSKLVRQKLRRGVADMTRRAQVSQACNNRYLDAISATKIDRTVEDILRDVTQPVKDGTQQARGLRPHDPIDLKLIQAVCDGQHNVHGFRNWDIRKRIEPITLDDPKATGRASARISRKLRMLKLHGLLKKPAGTNKYYLTDKGRLVFATILALQRTSAKELRNAG